MLAPKPASASKGAAMTAMLVRTGRSSNHAIYLHEKQPLSKDGTTTGDKPAVQGQPLLEGRHSLLDSMNVCVSGTLYRSMAL